MQLFPTTKSEIDCFSPACFFFVLYVDYLYIRDTGALIGVSAPEELQQSSLRETHQKNICFYLNDKALSSNLFRFILKWKQGSKCHLHLIFICFFFWDFSFHFSFPFLGLKTIILNISCQENTMTRRRINIIKTNDRTCPVPIQHCFSEICQDLKRCHYLNLISSDLEQCKWWNIAEPVGIYANR